ncbi:MAG TPA: serine/threonine-protein kinase [Kofleriaceae bacterium]|nr:serine/threonine-protein kinase [Kofleriaceae bacterium]
MDDYEVGDLLGRGGMGEVHIAQHKTGRIVAIKRVHETLSCNQTICDRLADEAYLLGRIDHPNVVSAVESGIDSDGRPFLVMSRAFGCPLDASIAMEGPLSRDRMLAVVSQLLAGIIAIHEARVIHADLKSANVMVDEIDRVTIIDFGLARTATGGSLATSHFDGTPAYLAPEIMAGHGPSVAGDIFATGVIVYEMLTGSTPLASHLPPEVVFALRLHEPVEPPSKRAPGRAITKQLDDVLLCALDRNPRERFSTVRELADALAEALAGWEPEPVASSSAIAFVDQPTLLRTSVAETIIAESLRQASARIRERDVAGAVMTLEQALARLASTHPRLMTPMAWRIETVLAALYHGAGKLDHAQRLARVAHHHALKTECEIARARTTALLEQLARGRRRIARGSGGGPR